MQMQKCRLHRDAGTWRYGNRGICGLRDMGMCVWGCRDMGTKVPGCEAEKVIHSVGMVLEATGLLEELEGGDAESLGGHQSLRLLGN